MATKLTPADIERIHQMSIQLASEESMRGSEADLVSSFMTQWAGGAFEDRIPLTAECTVVAEFAFKRGRADIVVFHSDGSATVIEVKDGLNGYMDVVKGVGQVGLYATQLAMQRSVSRVRRALMWGSTGDLFTDALIEEVCEQAGVVPLPMASSTLHRAAAVAVSVFMANAAKAEA